MEKYVVITGASNGIGRSLAENLVTSNYKVYNLDIEEQTKPHDDRIIHIDCDVRSGISIRKAFNQVLNNNQNSNFKLVALVNNAGVNHLDWFEKITQNNWDKVMDTNVKGTFFVIQEFLELLKKDKSTIVNIISNAAKKPMTCSSVYNASKGAVEIMTRSLARELTPNMGITVFGISPNKILDTKMSEYVDKVVPNIRNWSKDFAKKYEIAGIPCRENTPLDIFTDYVAYLIKLEENNKYLSGNILEYGV